MVMEQSSMSPTSSFPPAVVITPAARGRRTITQNYRSLISCGSNGAFLTANTFISKRGHEIQNHRTAVRKQFLLRMHDRGPMSDGAVTAQHLLNRLEEKWK